MNIAHVSTFPQLKCGIAFYTNDLIGAIPTMKHHKFALHYGQNVTPDSCGDADSNDYTSIRSLARRIAMSDCDVISLQHEFGIWGGVNGDHILDFLEHTTKPIVATLHTTFDWKNRPAIRSLLLRKLIERSHTSLVLTPESRNTLCASLQIASSRISVVPHGVPGTRFVRLRRPGKAEPWRFCTVGFFRPNKGIEETLHALKTLADTGQRFVYTIAGAPQPQFSGQTEYIREIRTLIDSLGLSGSVELRASFLSRKEQLEYISGSHAGIFAYQDPDHASSGVLPLVLAAGRPIICTPFEFAFAKRRELGHAVTVANGFGRADIYDAISRLIASEVPYANLTATLFRKTRSWQWGVVGRRYAEAFTDALAKRESEPSDSVHGCEVSRKQWVG